MYREELKIILVKNTRTIKISISLHLSFWNIVWAAYLTTIPIATWYILNFVFFTDVCVS